MVVGGDRGWRRWLAVVGGVCTHLFKPKCECPPIEDKVEYCEAEVRVAIVLVESENV